MKLRWKTFAVLIVFGATIVSLGAQRTGRTGSALTALDDYEIQQLDARFCHGLDSAADSGYQFADVFVADGVYVDPTGHSYKGREQLATLARQDPDGRKSPTNIVHYTTNMMITPVRDGVRGESYILIATQGQQAGGVDASGFYRDDLVKTADGWRIKKRAFVRASP